MFQNARIAPMKNEPPIYAVDAETDPFKRGKVPKPFLWGATHIRTKEFIEFDNTDDFLEWCLEQPEGTIMYAHNGGKFDWQLDDFIEHIRMFAPVMVIAGRISRFYIGHVEFRDSWNILPSALKATGGKKDIDISKLEAKVRHLHMDEIREYHKADCDTLADAIAGFIDMHGIVLTVAGASMKLWEKISGQKVEQSNANYYKRFAPFYTGGRVEVFKPGIYKGDFKSIDINSAYAKAMLSKHPKGLKYDHLDYLPEMDDDELGRCFIRLMAKSTGAFPYRYKCDKRKTMVLEFPNDGKVREFYITGWEYIAARDTKTLRTPIIHECYRFHDSVSFEKYIIPISDEREKAKAEGDDIQALLLKHALTNLYGKFGANPDKYKEHICVPNDAVAEAIEWGWDIEGPGPAANSMFMSQKLDEKQKRFYNVATAASITGYVRAMLWRVIHASEGVLYCDTDCVMAVKHNNVHYHPTELGAWDIEAECVEGAFAGKKLYAVKKREPDKKGKLYKIASKGVKLDQKQIYAIAKGAKVRYEKDAPTFKRVRGKDGERVTWLARNVKRIDIDD